MEKKMNKLFDSLKNIFAIILITILLVSYFAVFLPMQNELKDALENNFQKIIDVSEILFENHLNRAVEGVKGLSSRTMIRDQLAAYNRGEITLEALREFTQPKYKDGVETLQYVVSAYRTTGGKVVADYGVNKEELLRGINAEKLETEFLKITADQKYLVVKSAIKNQTEEILGFDYLIYDLKLILAELENLNSENIDYKIIIAAGGGPQAENNGAKLVEYRRLLATDYYLGAEIPDRKVYSEANKISYRIMLLVFMAIIIISLLVMKLLGDTSVEIINELRKELQQKTKLSETDEMLGIFNRAKFDKEIKNEIERAKRYKNSLSLIMVDIDNFKDFNDNYGHQIGDEVLKEMVNLLSDGIRKSDLLARYGGDEFAIICPETKLKDAEKLAKRLKNTVERYNSEHDDILSCSFGVAEFKTAKDDKESFIQRADQALYQAKEAGRNEVCCNY